MIQWHFGKCKLILNLTFQDGIQKLNNNIDIMGENGTPS